MSRYLSPEPLLNSVNWVTGEAGRGFGIPSYAYARSNPVRNTDPSGLCVSTYDCCIENNPGNPAACGGFKSPKPFELPKFDPKSLLKPFKKVVEDVCKVAAMSATIECTESSAILDEINKCLLRADRTTCVVAVCDYAKQNCVWNDGFPHAIDKHCM